MALIEGFNTTATDDVNPDFGLVPAGILWRFSDHNEDLTQELSESNVTEGTYSYLLTGTTRTPFGGTEFILTTDTVDYTVSAEATTLYLDAYIDVAYAVLTLIFGAGEAAVSVSTSFGTTGPVTLELDISSWEDYTNQPITIWLIADNGGGEPISVWLDNLRDDTGPVNEEVEVPATSFELTTYAPVVFQDFIIPVPATTFELNSFAPTVIIAENTNVVVPLTQFELIAFSITTLVDTAVTVPLTQFSLIDITPAVKVIIELDVPGTSFSMTVPTISVALGQAVSIPLTRFEMLGYTIMIDIDGYEGINPTVTDFYSDISPVAELGEVDGIS